MIFCFDKNKVSGAAERTSRVSSRSSMHGRTVPSGSHVGTSFIECTQMSTSSPRSATSSSFVKRPLPPISLSAPSDLAHRRTATVKAAGRSAYSSLA